jgi:energy-coupling factor transporter ATP-binding protein EcfA2
MGASQFLRGCGRHPSRALHSCRPDRRARAGRVINLRHIEKSDKNSGGEIFVLRRIHPDVKPGEFVSIMGPSGAGKSTLFHTLGMHDTKYRGDIRRRRPLPGTRRLDRDRGNLAAVALRDESRPAGGGALRGADGRRTSSGRPPRCKCCLDSGRHHDRDVVLQPKRHTRVIVVSGRTTIDDDIGGAVLGGHERN